MSTVLQGSKSGSGSQHTPTEAHDSLVEVQRARIVDALCEGPIRGFVHGGTNPLLDVYLNETPVCNADGTLNFTNIAIDSRYGTQDQSAMAGFSGVENEIAVGVELRASAPWVQALTDLSLSAVRVRLQVPQFQRNDTSTGDVTGLSVHYTIEVSTDGGSFVLLVNGSISGKTSSEYDRVHRIDLPAATTGWTLRVTRTTPNADSATVADTTNIASYTEIIDAQFRYPNTAVVGLIVDAKQFSSVPSRTYNCYGRTMPVPSNYNPITRAYSGTWDGTFKTAWTNNPAWIFYDLVTHPRFGLGQWVTAARVNKWNLYEIAQYCDELVPDGNGGMEPRFACTVYFQTQADAYKVLADLASVFRGMAFWAGGAIQAVADMPGDPDFPYTNANVVNGQFTYQGSKGKTRYTVALVSWNNPANFGRPKVSYVPDRDGIARYGVQPTSLIAVGCTSEGQAHRVGLWALLTSRLETETVTFQVGADGTLVAPGRIITVADARRALSRQGGRIGSAVTGTNLLAYATDLSHWAPVNGTLGVGATAPGGAGLMTRLTCTTANANVQMAETAAVTTGATYALSVYVRRDQNRYVKLFGFGNGSGGAVIDLQTGATQVNSTWLSVGVEMIDAVTARVYGVVQPITSGQALIGMAANMAGTATVTVGSALDFWGAQLEPGNTVHALVPTGATAGAFTTVMLDAVPGVIEVGGTLTVMLPSGVSESHPITAITGNNVTTAAFSETLQPDAVWTVETPELAAQTFRVISIAEPQSSDAEPVYTVTALQHNASKFAAIDTGAMVFTPPTVRVDGGSLSAPSVVSVTSFARKGTTRAIPVLVVGWPRVPGATKYMVQYRVNSGEWSPVHVVTGAQMDLPNVLPGVYEAQVAAANNITVSPATVSLPYTLDDSALTPTILDDISSEAHAAQLDATSALAQIGSIGSDGVLAQGEKKTVIRDYNVLTTEQAGIDEQATSFGVTTEKAAYDASIAALTAYLATLTLPTLWNDMTGDTTVVRATFWSKWQAAYIARQACLNAIYAAAKKANDDAIKQANAHPVNNPQFQRDLTGWTFDSSGVGEWYREGLGNSPDASVSTYLVHKGMTGQATTRARNTGGGLLVTPGQGVVAAVALRALSVNAGARAYIAIGWYNSAGAEIGAVSQGAAICTNDAGTNNFVQGVSRVVGIAPAGAVRAVLEIEFDGHTTGYYSATNATLGFTASNTDEIPNGASTSTLAGMQGSALTIGNGNFMAPALPDGSIPGWSRYNSATIDYFNGNLPSGNGQSLRVTATGSTPAGFGAQSPSYKASAGDVFTASVWTVASTGGLSGIFIYFFNAAGSFLAVAQGTATAFGPWQKVTATTAAAPAGTAYAFIRLFNSGTGGGVSYFYDVHATRLTPLASEVTGTLSTQRNLPLVTWGNYGGAWSGLSLTYTLTTTSCTFSASAASFVGGGDSIAYNAGSKTVSGSAGSTVTYYLYYDDPNMVGGSQTLQATTSAITSLNANGRVLVNTVKVTFPTSGTGSGGGSVGGCPQIDEPVIRRAPDGSDEVIRAGDVRVGDHLRLASGQWGRVTYSEQRSQPGVRVEGAGGAVHITCSSSAPLETAEGPCVRAAYVRGLVLKHRVLGIVRVTDVVDLGVIRVQHITCENDCFWVRDFSHHNLKASPPG